MYESALRTLTVMLCASVLLPPTESRDGWSGWSPNEDQRTDTPLRSLTTRPATRAPLRTTTTRLTRVFTTCGRDNWHCSDGSCIHISHRCDSYRNCPDGSDEFNCSDFRILKDLWEEIRVCNYQWGECMPVGGATCGHGIKIGISDVPECYMKRRERRCYIKCDRHGTTTKASASTKSSSIPTLLRSVDLFGDATSATPVCRAEQWTCGDGSCIDMSHRCDRRQYHCPDGTDEFDCDQPPIGSQTTRSQTQLSSEVRSVHLSCSANEWPCNDGACIPLSQRCDGRIYHCPDGSDEFNC